MCLLVAGATIEVADSDDNIIQKLSTANISPQVTPEGSNVDASNSTGLNSAGMQSMVRNATEHSTDAICGSNAYLLPLQLGQNDFDIDVTPPEPFDQVSIHSVPKK